MRLCVLITILLFFRCSVSLLLTASKGGLHLSHHKSKSTCIRRHNLMHMHSSRNDEQILGENNLKHSRGIPINIPNILTVARVAAIPFFILSFIASQKLVGVTIYAVACLTDFVDGYIARKFNQTSAFGAFLDPVADKMMVATAMVMLTNQIPTWWFTTPVSLILCREIGVSALREWMAEQGQRAVVKVGVIGKWKTAIQMISTALLLYAAPEVNGSRNEMVFTNMTKISPLFTIGVILLYISAYLTLLSGWQYFTAAWPSISSSDDK